MPVEKRSFWALGLAALLVAALGLGLFLGTPDTAVAQEETTTTTVVDDSADQASEEPSDDDRPARGDHDCGDRAETDAAEESSTNDT